MRLLSSLAILSAACVALVGCSGHTDPAADVIDLVLSEPSGGTNVNLVRFDTANDWQRSRNNLSLNVFASQTPGPTGLSTRSVRIVINQAIPNTTYSMNPGSLNYVEVSETAGGSVRTWRSEAGSVHLGADNSKESNFTISNVYMAPQSGSAIGNFKIHGPLIIRF